MADNGASTKVVQVPHERKSVNGILYLVGINVSIMVSGNGVSRFRV